MASHLRLVPAQQIYAPGGVSERAPPFIKKSAWGEVQRGDWRQSLRFPQRALGSRGSGMRPVEGRTSLPFRKLSRCPWRRGQGLRLRFPLSHHPLVISSACTPPHLCRGHTGSPGRRESPAPAAPASSPRTTWCQSEATLPSAIPEPELLPPVVLPSSGT